MVIKRPGNPRDTIRPCYRQHLGVLGHNLVPGPSLTTSIFRPYKAIIFQLVIEGRRILVAHHFGISGDYRKLSSGCDGGVGCDDGPGGGADAFG